MLSEKQCSDSKKPRGAERQEQHMNQKNTPEAFTLPYPLLTEETISRDPRFARTVMPAYYGELASVSAYVYRSIVSDCDFPALSSLFEELAVDEAEHFRSLGRLIRLLGSDPIIRTELSVPSAFLREKKQLSKEEFIRRLLAESIREEDAALTGYKRLAQHSTGTLASLFLRIATDEERHLQMLKRFGAAPK